MTVKLLLTWDILFLIPVPWVGPVLSPIIVAMTMIVAGVVVLWRESIGRPVAVQWYHWSAIVVGGLIIVVAFCWDWRNSVAGRYPNPFNWPLFAVGEAIGVVAFVHALLLRNKQS